MHDFEPRHGFGAMDTAILTQAQEVKLHPRLQYSDGMKYLLVINKLLHCAEC